jgi:hypothetical protein
MRKTTRKQEGWQQQHRAQVRNGRQAAENAAGHQHGGQDEELEIKRVFIQLALA